MKFCSQMDTMIFAGRFECAAKHRKLLVLVVAVILSNYSKCAVINSERKLASLPGINASRAVRVRPAGVVLPRRQQHHSQSLSIRVT